jgi:hypothetical protein
LILLIIVVLSSRRKFRWNLVNRNVYK